MRRSPFKFFFGISVGVILFFFLARVFVTALFLAAAMSLIFFVFRKIKNFFKYMPWEEERYAYQNDYRYQKNLPFWEREEEPLFDNRQRRFDKRIIVIE